MSSPYDQKKIKEMGEKCVRVWDVVSSALAKVIEKMRSSILLLGGSLKMLCTIVCCI